MKYETSLPHEIAAEIEKMPVAYLPWGAHEWHGPHNPVGLDGLKAQFLARELCKEVGGVVFPPVYCGASTIGDFGFPYCISFSPAIVESLAREYLQKIADMGFKLIVIAMGHWPGAHEESINRAVNEFNESQSKIRAWALRDDSLTEAFGYPEDHGGTGETSYIMASACAKIDLSYLPDDREISFEKDGMTGEDPRTNASAERGWDAAKVYVREASKRILAIMNYEL